jgi:hypothetical protein
MENSISPDNISGFVVGEGCFYVEFGQDGMYRHKVRVRPSFVVEVAEHDRPILEAMQQVIGCGTVYNLDYGRYEKYASKNWKPHVRFKVSNFADISTKLIPFFDKHVLFGKKKEAFDAFKAICQAVGRKEHLTPEGLITIKPLIETLRSINKRGV